MMGSVEMLVESALADFIGSSANRLEGLAEPAWGPALVGFSSGADQLFEFFKRDIGPFHLMPVEFFADSFAEASPSELAVITWVLPQTEATKADHRGETHFPSERWARSRTFGERVNDEIRRHVVDALARTGIDAVAPVLSPLFHTRRDSRYGRASTWSERHAAHVAGLGTFGLSEGLITPVGKAVRLGSVVARAEIEPTERPYEDHRAYCLFYSKGSCGECIDRCPIGAITKAGHDKELCARYGGMCSRYIERHYGFKGTGCGLCQTRVPCESSIPADIIRQGRDPG